MKLYDSMGPNPHVVRMFIAEKALEIPREEVDLMGGANRQHPFAPKSCNRGWYQAASTWSAARAAAS